MDSYSEVRLLSKMDYKPMLPYDYKVKAKELSKQWEKLHEGSYNARFIITINEPEHIVTFQLDDIANGKRWHSEVKSVLMKNFLDLRYEDIFPCFANDVKHAE